MNWSKKSLTNAALALTVISLACSSLLALPSSAHAGATVTVVNLDPAGVGFNDPTPFTPVGGNPATTVGQARMNAFQYAADVWGSLIESPVEIRVGANWDSSMDCAAGWAVLGSAGPETVNRDFGGAPLAGTWYATALANSLAGSDLVGGTDDIGATFNPDIGTTGCLESCGWYYGFDGNAPGCDVDFVGTALHEMGHGLGFLTFVSLCNAWDVSGNCTNCPGTKLLGYNDTYMVNLEDHSAVLSFPAMTNGQRCTASTDDGDLHWTGSSVMAMEPFYSAGFGAGNHAEMYAPSAYETGSSVSHFNTTVTPNDLMEPFHNNDATVDLTLAAMEDMGWVLVPDNLAPGTPSALAQYKSNGSTVIAQGGSTDESTVVVKATVTDPDGDTVQLQVEMVNTAGAYTGTPTCSSSFVASGATATATCSGLSNGVSYKWRARGSDGSLAGSWQTYGASDPDVTVIMPATDPALRGFNLPDTGQTGCWDAAGTPLVPCPRPGDAMAQDGSYTMLPPTYQVDGLNGVVYDRNTDLMWQQDDDGALRTWADADTYCSGLSQGGLGGWRLPSKKELTSILSFGLNYPTIDPTAFPTTQTDIYWTASEDFNNTARAWVVDFVWAETWALSKVDAIGAYARCVRRPPVTTGPFTPDLTERTVLDASTHRMWELDNAGAMTWEGALAYCEQLSLGGFADWRLPSARELESITDDGAYFPAIPAAFAGGSPVSDFYWTATSDPFTPDYAWTVDFLDGSLWNQDSKDPSVTSEVRCVRGGRPDAPGTYAAGSWYLDNGNAAWDGCGTDVCAGPFGGGAQDVSISGDWDGDGLDQVGVYRNGYWYLDNGNAVWDGCGTFPAQDRCLGPFGGNPTDFVIVGNWDGIAGDEVGVFRVGSGMWFLDNGNAVWDGCGSFPAQDVCEGPFGANATDIPIIGDWDGDGVDEVGVFRRFSGRWFLDNGNGIWNDCVTDQCLGPFGANASDWPVSGDWDGDGVDQVGVYRTSNDRWFLDSSDGVWQDCHIDTCAGPFGPGAVETGHTGKW